MDFHRAAHHCRPFSSSIKTQGQRTGLCASLEPRLEKAVAPHSSTLAWKIPWTEEPGGLQSIGSLRVGHDWATSLSLFTFMHWRRKWRPTPVFLPGESQGWWEPCGLPSMGSQSRTRLKRLNSRTKISLLKQFPKWMNYKYILLDIIFSLVTLVFLPI